jgi:DNA-binding NtrC family response regulator
MTLQLVRDLKKKSSDLPLILAMEQYNADEMIELLKVGIIDFITSPFKTIDILPRIWRILKYRTEEENITYILKERVGLRQLIGACPAFIQEIKILLSLGAMRLF